MKPLAAGVDWTRALGEPVSTGRIRCRAADFRVDEYLGFEGSGTGEHLLLQIEKSNLNTVDAVKMLAEGAGVAARDVGYSGLKDRHAVCTQWLTLPRPPSFDWRVFERPGLRILAAGRHHRKLKRGTHRGNRFRIRVALDALDTPDLERRLRAVRDGGVPNYFGEQRFGRRFEANARCILQGRRLPRMQRSMTLSGIRSGLFNRVLDRRVRDGSWNTALPGEYLNLDGTGSGFAVSDGDPDIARRVEAMDLHPTAPLYGAGASPAAGAVASLEDEVIRDCRAWCDVLARAGLKMERRPARCVVRELDWRLDGPGKALEMTFTLRRGQFATSVLREILSYRDAASGVTEM